MKKIIWWVLMFLFLIASSPSAFYGTFFDGTASRDSVFMHVATFDTLGRIANADTVWILRFYRSTLIDSTQILGAGTRTGFYISGKRAFDGTNYGEYTVGIRWSVNGKQYRKSESYMVTEAYANANIMQINSQATSAQNLNKLLDGDTTWGTNPIVTSSWFYSRAEVTDRDGIYAEGNGAGNGIQGKGYHGIKGDGEAGGAGIFGVGYHGMRLNGTGEYGHDLYLGTKGHIAGWIDSVSYIDNASDQITQIQNYLGAGNNWRQWLMPFSEAHKCSLVTFNGATKKATIYVYPDTLNPAIPDSTLQTDW